MASTLFVVRHHLFRAVLPATASTGLATPKATSWLTRRQFSTPGDAAETSAWGMPVSDMPSDELQLKPKKMRKKTRLREKDPSVFDPTDRPTATVFPHIAEKLKASPSSVGKRRMPTHTVPDEIVKVVDALLTKYCAAYHCMPEQVLESAVKMRNFLNFRHAPKETSEVRKLEMQILKEEKEKLEKELSHDDDLTDEQLKERLLRIETTAKTRSKNDAKRYWKQIDYDETGAWSYLLGRAAYDYATVYKVLKEVGRREPDFKPRTLLDFGSGVGTAIWAAQSVFGAMNEIMAVDSSPAMLDMTKATMSARKSVASLDSGTFFRVRVPSSDELPYDLVTCCHTLLEMPNAAARVTAIDKLWRKTTDFLVIIEDGTNAGFQAVSEARDYLLQVSQAEHEESHLTGGHIFAPCPHQNRCPRYHLDTVPCNFDVKYSPLGLRAFPHLSQEAASTDRFCYVVFRKGTRHQTTSCTFARLLEEPVHKPHFSLVRACTNRGRLEEIFVAKKADKVLRRYTERVHCGDQLEVHLEDSAKEDSYWKIRKANLKEAEESESE